MTVLLFCIFAVYVTAFFIASRWFARREGYYSTVAVFGIAAFIYYLAIPLEVALTSEELRVGYFVEYLSAPLQVQIAALGLMAFVSFVAGYACSGFAPLPSGDVEENPKAAGSPLAGIPLSLRVLAICSTGLLAVAFAQQVLAMSTYETAYETTHEHPVFSLTSQTAVVTTALCGALLLFRRPRHWLGAALCFLFIGAWGVYTSDKNPMLVALLGTASCFWFRPLKKSWVLPALLLVALLLLTAMPVFSLYRAGYRWMDLWLEYYFGVSRTDPRGPMLTLIDTLSASHSPLWGQTYVQNLYAWVPSFLWPGRPLDLAESFARRNMPGWLPGQGFGFSLLAESYLNFGWFGPLIQYSMLGFAWGKGWNLIRRALQPVSEAYWRATYATVGFYLLILMHRGPTTATIKTWLQICLLLVAFRLIFDRARAPSPSSAPSLRARGATHGGTGET